VRSTLESWGRELRYAARALVRARLFTTVTVLTLALSIGANTAIFSLVKVVLLKPLPFPNADRLVHIGGTAPGLELPDRLGLPDELYFAYRRDVPAIEDLALYNTGSSTTRVDGQVEQLFLSRVTPTLFSTLGARPAIGRLPNADDDDKVVVLSNWLWHSWFGADSSVLGRSYYFAGETRSIIGVMPPEFRFPGEDVAFWLNWPLQEAAVTPGGFGPNAVARVAPGIGNDALLAQIAPMTSRVQEQLGGPATYTRIMERYRPVITPLKQQLVGDVAQALWILLGAAGVVFLIACANIANLFMVRGEVRRRDLAVRRALGSGRAGLVRTQMSEALLLAVAGGMGGALLARVAVPLLVRAAPEGVTSGFGGSPIPGLSTAGVDGVALLFTLAISLIAAFAFGLYPALRMSGAGLLATLRQGGRGIVGRQHLTRDTLVVVQTALALVLLVGSALLVRSFLKLRQVDGGYDTRNIFTFQIAADRDDLKDRASMSRFQYEFMDRLKALPGVESVGYANSLPLDEGASLAFVTTPALLASGAEPMNVRVTGAGGAYFQTMGISLLSGRYFERIEEQQGIPNVIISASAAKLLFPGRDPLGEQVRPAEAQGDEWFTVTGVVEDVILDDFRRKTPEAMVYLPSVSGSPAYVMRSPRAEQLAPEVREIIREMVPRSPMYRISTMEHLAANTMARLSFTMLMLLVAAGLALVLAAVGLYGVLSYQVSRRTHEIGVRIALGAESGAVQRLIVGQGGRVALLGVLVGLVAAAALTRFLASLLFDVGSFDLVTFAAMSAVMLLVAVVASYIPARRASAVDPVQAMRAE
jgi:predicted permease